uniref:Uncharacterized protein n=1 Tax=Globodera rostochiensis TaxID=31243 RepID=A0A914HVY8_GLORO
MLTVKIEICFDRFNGSVGGGTLSADLIRMIRARFKWKWTATAAADVECSAGGDGRTEGEGAAMSGEKTGFMRGEVGYGKCAFVLN